MEIIINKIPSNLFDWQRAALQFLPELEEEIREAETPYQLWIILLLRFKDCYRESCDDTLNRRIYEFGRWCFSQPRKDSAAEDLLTCVFVCFFEHILDCQSARDDVLRWISVEDFAVLFGVFAETLNPDEYKTLFKQFI